MACNVSSTEYLCVFVCVHKPEDLFGGERIMVSLLLLPLYGVNGKYLEVWHCSVRYSYNWARRRLLSVTIKINIPFLWGLISKFEDSGSELVGLFH